jgi:hypothetical protein
MNLLDAERFWSKVDTDVEGGCWIWHGTCNSKGYGYFWVDGQQKQARRLSYELMGGILAPQQELKEVCGNKLCVNPTHLMHSIEDRFWNKVAKQPSGCWNWRGSIGDKGYGQFRIIKSKQVIAHRFSFELANGPIPAGLLVCHTCDNRRCVNPAHLFLGTYKDNTQDMMRKGRESGPPICFGNKNAARLTPADVIQIRQLHSAGHSQVRLALDYGVSGGCISLIVRRETWRNI